MMVAISMTLHKNVERQLGQIVFSMSVLINVKAPLSSFIMEGEKQYSLTIGLSLLFSNSKSALLIKIRGAKSRISYLNNYLTRLHWVSKNLLQEWVILRLGELRKRNSLVKENSRILTYFKLTYRKIT